ncbi:MAG: STAS domain-containing protein [Candidatus Sulfopaludibacter sp.]|nr:STAS domain-containing protein [Candidatus Sulfopaludibacter sp.]
MTENCINIKIDPEQVAHTLRQEAVEQLAGAGNEVLLDFGAVPRIDANAIRALEELAGLADDRSVRVVLRAVNMDIYRVLKLMNLAARFRFVS